MKNMSGKDVKTNITYLENPLKIENEPEEGEIVDEYDLIVSSDEELCMRQRIRELEAENEEIEQIAVISRSYVNKIESSRPADLPTDVSSISSAEFVTPKKRKRRKSREHKRKHCHRQRRDDQQYPPKSRSKRTHCKRRQKLFAKKYKKNHSYRDIHKVVNEECLSIESLESSDSSSFTDTDTYSCDWLGSKRKEEYYNKEKYITRDTLRLAVARNTNGSRLDSRKYCLKDKLLKQEVGQPSNKSINIQCTIDESRGIAEDNNNDDDDDVQVIENEPDIQTVDEDSTDSMEEKELRLIALKSAVLKKHMARKMRNAESAYSPTDFDEIISQDKLDDICVIDLEDEDSQTACATISPVASPQLMILEDQEESQQMVDCKPVDMDIANSDSEGIAIDSWSKDSEHFPQKYSLDSSGYSKNDPYDDFYLQNLHELPPPPPGVDDYEDVPPPPPYHMIYIRNEQDMDLDNELAEDHSLGDKYLYSPGDEKHANNKFLPQIEFRKNEEEAEDGEEEEEALRALLLSKFNSPKNQTKTRNSKECIESKNTSNKTDGSEWNLKKKPTEFILKEAVKRLKVHSQSDVCAESATDVPYIKPKCSVDGKSEQYQQNSCDSLNILEKLSNRFTICQNMHMKPTSSVRLKCNKDECETAANLNDEISGEPTPSIVSERSELTSKIDISDITRRLEKIKENVLNSTYNILSKDSKNSNSQAMNEVSSANEYIRNTGNEVGCNVMKTVSKNSDSIHPITKTKTVKANFDVTTKQTTFKITIKNNDSWKSTNNDIVNTLNDVTYKENNASNVPKNETLKSNASSKIGDKLVKIVDSKADSTIENIAELTKPVIIAKSVMAVIPTPTYPLQRGTKIVKPNKVINAKFDLKPKLISHLSESTQISKSEVIGQLSKVPDNSRLITSIDQVKHMCTITPFVISLQNSSNESSEDDFGADYDSLYKPLYEYNDNTSPLSLNLESPSRTPLRSNSPIEASVEGRTLHTDLEAFNSKTKITSQKENVVARSAPRNSNQSAKINKTPLAVRHLPAAAQSEYRKLVHRMKLLENKRKVSNLEANKKEPSLNKSSCGSSSVVKNPNKEKSSSDSTNASLVKKVLLRNAVIDTTDTQIAKGPSSSSKQQRSNVLRSYENLYIKFGAGIVNNLDKSLKLVEDAKRAKLAKLSLENRLKELKAEMDILQNKHKEEQQKISHIYPHICTTNEIITSLKQKRSKVFKAALNLGKTLKGSSYRLNNDLKEIINTKSNLLATEIKAVNSLKVQDVKNVEIVAKPNTTEEQHTDNIEKQMKDCKAKSETNNTEIKSNPNTTSNNTKICSKRCKEEEKNNLETNLNAEVGGNIEFQDLENNDTKSRENSVNTGPPDVAIQVKNTCSENGSEQTLSLQSYISPLEHLRNIDSNVDPNGVICPYDLMGNCEDSTCKYVHIHSCTS